MRTCPGCETDLSDAHVRRKFCSNACRRWVANGHTEPRRPADVCATCDQPMSQKLVSAIYCSRSCKNRASEKRRDRDDAARYLRERDRRIVYAIEYAKRNPHVGQVSKRNRRAASAKGRVSPRDWRRLCRRYGGRCAYCSAKASLTMDHVVPLVRGGSNTIGNILPACRPCNCRKQGRFIMEWRLGKSRSTERRVDALAAVNAR